MLVTKTMFKITIASYVIIRMILVQKDQLIVS